MRKLLILAFLVLVALPAGASNLARHYPSELVLGGPADAVIHKFGGTTDLDTVDGESVISTLESYWQPTAAETVRIKSGGNAADDTAGSGCREVTIEGIDETYALASEAVATAGASVSSATTTTFYRVFRAYCSGTGTYKSANTGAITIEEGDGGGNIAQIAASAGQSEIAAYTVPASTTCGLMNVTFSVDTTKSADIRAYKLADVDDASAPMRALRLFKDYEGAGGFAEQSFIFPEVFAAKTDIIFKAVAAANDTEISLDFTLVCRTTS